MENESALGRAWDSFSDKIQDLPAYQQLKTKWDEQPERTRMGIKLGSVILTTVVLSGVVIGSWVTVSGQRQELEKKLELVRKIQLSSEELNRLKNITRGPGLSSGGDWKAYFEGRATEAGIGVESLSVNESKSSAPKSGDANTPEETLVNLQVKKVNVRHLVKLVFNIENGPRTAKVRNLQVETQPDESGYLDVTVAVSGFNLTREQ